MQKIPPAGGIFHLYKTSSVVGANPENLEGLFVFGELFQIFFGEDFLDVGLIGWVDQGDAGTLEASTRETSAIDSGEGAHDVVDGDELGGATLVVVDGALAGVKGEFAEELEIARLPSCNALAHAAVFRIEMLSAARKAGWHGNAGLLERGLRNIAEEGLIERLEGLVGIGQHVPGGCLAFVDAEVVIAVDE